MNANFQQTRQAPIGNNRRLFSLTAVAAAVALSLAGITAIANTATTLPESSPLTIERSAARAP